MGYIGRGNNGDIPQVVGVSLVIKELTELTLQNLTVTSGANLPPFNQLIVVQTGISTLGTVQSGVWNGSVIGEAYGGTGKSTYNEGDLLVGNSTAGLNVLASGAEGSQLQIQAGALSWVDPVAPNVISNVNIATGPSYDVTNDQYLVAVSGATLVGLPTAPQTGETHIIKDRAGTASSTNIVVSGSGNLIDGEATKSLTNDYQSFTLIWDGAQWLIV